MFVSLPVMTALHPDPSCAAASPPSCHRACARCSDNTLVRESLLAPSSTGIPSCAPRRACRTGNVGRDSHGGEPRRDSRPSAIRQTPMPKIALPYDAGWKPAVRCPVRHVVYSRFNPRIISRSGCSTAGPIRPAAGLVCASCGTMIGVGRPVCRAMVSGFVSSARLGWSAL